MTTLYLQLFVNIEIKLENQLMTYLEQYSQNMEQLILQSFHPDSRLLVLQLLNIELSGRVERYTLTIIL